MTDGNLRFAYVRGSRTREASVSLSLRLNEPDEGRTWAHTELTPHEARLLAGWLERSADTAVRAALRPREGEE